MLKAEELIKTRITGPKTVLRDVINELYALKLMHLIEYKKRDADFFDIGKPFEEAQLYSEALVNLRSMMAYFQIKSADKTSMNASKQLTEKINALHNEFKEKITRVKELETEIKKCNEQLLQKTLSLQITTKDEKKLKNTLIIAGTSKKDLQKEIEDKVPNSYVIKKSLGKGFVFSIFVKKEEKEKLLELLRKNNFIEEKLPEKTREEIEIELKKLESEKASIEDFLEKFKKENEAFFVQAEKALSTTIEKAEAPLKFATTKNAFIIEGWIPVKKLQEFEKRINKSSNEKVLIERFKEKEGMPVALDNPKALKPFEFFLRLYTLPKAYELDPTILTAITFPLFFGFMLGDIGYGLVVLLLLIAGHFFIKAGQLKALINIMTIASIASIIFGFVFGEFFGFYITEHPLLHRAHDLNLMLMLTVLIGAIHINLGLILGFINKYWEHGLKHAIFEKLSWLTLEFSVILLFLGHQIIGALIALASIIMLFKGEGIRGLIEVPSLLSNILSYARLFALGLASLKLAEIINELAMPLFQSGNIALIALGVLTLLLGHALNIFLGVLGPFIQSLRLHYVEFFTKFFEGGGKEFKPFGS